MNKRIADYIRAGYSGLAIVSHEEQRVEALLREVVCGLNKTYKDQPFRLLGWSCTEGLVDSLKGEIADKDCGEPLAALDWFLSCEDTRVILVLRDFHLFLEDKNPVVYRKWRDAMLHGKARNKTLIVVGCRITLPPELEKEVAVLDFALPDKEQLRRVLHGIQKTETPEEADILRAASGLTTIEAENAFALSIIEAGKVTPGIVFREKCQTVRKNGLLEIVESKVTLDDIGGLESLKTWLVNRRDAFSDDAVAYGLPTPRGMLTVGQPGTGKSLTAKACRSVLGIPLLRLDAGRLFGSLVGQSEQNWRTAHATAKAMAPCILWIDEVDGAMSGASSSGHTDGGTTSRVIKSILQDMQENSEGIFFVLTANDVDNIPSPLLRRMDEVWNVELPNVEERKAVWQIQINRAKRDARKFDLDALAKASDGFSGAEIEKVVTQTLYVCFADGRREMGTADVLAVLGAFRPLSITMKDDIERRRKRLEGVAKLASGEVRTTAKSGGPNRKLVVAPGAGKN